MFKFEGFNVYIMDLGEEGVDFGKLYDYDIILFDLNLLDMSGFDVFKIFCLVKIGILILILFGFVGIENKVCGLGFGVDDYMIKLFYKDELVVCIYVVVCCLKGYL